MYRTSVPTHALLEYDRNLISVTGFQVSYGLCAADINECLGGLSDCDRRALCKNTEGSYTCTCTDGTLGDGKSCTSKSSDLMCCC